MSIVRGLLAVVLVSALAGVLLLAGLVVVRGMFEERRPEFREVQEWVRSVVPAGRPTTRRVLRRLRRAARRVVVNWPSECRPPDVAEFRLHPTEFVAIEGIVPMVRELIAEEILRVVARRNGRPWDGSQPRVVVIADPVIVEGFVDAVGQGLGVPDRGVRATQAARTAVMERDASVATVVDRPAGLVLHPVRGGVPVVVTASTLVGRSRACEVVSPDARVSRRHCRISRTGDGWRVEDLGSSNGTFVGGEPVTGERRLVDGDVVRLGSSGPSWRVTVGSGPVQ